jgi:hypothetical protein
MSGRLPHDRGGPDREEPGHADTHSGGDGPDHGIDPGGTTIRGDRWRCTPEASPRGRQKALRHQARKNSAGKR